MVYWDTVKVQIFCCVSWPNTQKAPLLNMYIMSIKPNLVPLNWTCSDSLTKWGWKYCSSLFMKVTNIKTPQTQEDEFIEIQSDTGTAFQRWTVRHMTMLQQVCMLLLHWTETQQSTTKEWKLFSPHHHLCPSQVMANIMSLSAPELRLQGLFLVIVWFCLAFRYHQYYLACRLTLSLVGGGGQAF